MTTALPPHSFTFTPVGDKLVLCALEVDNTAASSGASYSFAIVSGECVHAQAVVGPGCKGRVELLSLKEDPDQEEGEEPLSCVIEQV